MYIEKLVQDPRCTSRQVFLERCILNPTQIAVIERFTRAQAKSMLWHSLRTGRVTSSNFGGAISLATRNVEPSMSFLNYLLKTKDISNIPAIKYGIDNESVAIREYEQEFGCKVEKCGIFMDTCGYLGGSPDGLVGSDGIVEIKCPFRMKASSNMADFHRLGFLKKNSKDQFEVVTSHKYYHQIQGNLYLTKRKFCDFVVWTPQIMLCIRISQDLLWQDNIGLIQLYYVEKLVPKIKEFFENGGNLRE